MTRQEWNAALAQIEWPVVVALLAVHAALAWFLRVPGITTGNDDALYLLLADQLAQGQYQDAFLPGAPPHGRYPPGYPALLALGSSVFGRNLDALIALNIACSVIALVTFFRLVRGRFSPTVAMATLVATALNPALIEQAGAISSEPLFMLTIALSLALIDKSIPAAGGAVLGALAAGTTTLVRAAGAPFFIAQVAYWVTRRNLARALVAIVAGGLPVAAWLAWSWRTARDPLAMTYWSGENAVGPSPLSHGFGGIAHRLWDNGTGYLAHELPALLQLPTSAATVLDNVAWLAILLAALGTGTVVLWQRWNAALWYLLGYGALLILWTWPLSRFLQPVLPLIMAAMLAGLLTWPSWPRHVGRIAAMILLVGLATGFAAALTERVEFVSACKRLPFPAVSSCYLPRQQGFFSALQSAARLASDSDVLLTGKNVTATYVTGMITLPANHFVGFDTDRLRDELVRMNVRFIVAAHLLPFDARLAEKLNGICDSLALIERHPGDTLLLEVRETNDGRACAALNSRVPEALAMNKPAPW